MRADSFVIVLLICLAPGCGTTRQTDTQRAATEMLLVSQAVDQAVARLDFTPLTGKAVYLDVRYIDSATVDRGYVISSLRQHLLAQGVLLQDEKENAVYVVEPRSGGIGTDRNTILVGTPQLALPPVVPGVPTQIPELALMKKSDQKGVAKLAVFAYNRVNGRAVWQSGMVEEVSSLKDTWVFGAGPISRGSIRRHTEIAGEPLPGLPTLGRTQPESATGTTAPVEVVKPTERHHWVNADVAPPPQPVPYGLMGLVGPAPVVGRPVIQ